MLQQVKDDRQGFFIRNLKSIVDRRALEIGGDAPLADAFGDRGAFRFQLAGFDPRINRRAHGICGGDADAWVALFQSHRHARERSAGSDGASESIDLAVGLFPDFRPRGFDMCAPVRNIVELVGPNGAILLCLCQLLRQAPGNLYVIVCVPVRNSRNFDKLDAQ